MGILKRTPTPAAAGTAPATLRVQFVDHHPGPLALTFQRLYAETVQEHPSTWAGLPNGLRPYMQVVARGRGFNWSPGPDLPPLRVGPEPQRPQVCVGFTGGKDSTAAALALAAQGYSPVCIYVKGINRSFPQEEDKAREICRVQGWPFVRLQVRQSGSSAYADNPIKNQLILAMMMEWGAPHGITHYSQGTHRTDHVADLEHTTNGSDGVELYDALVPYLATLMPGFTYHHTMRSFAEAYVLVSRHGAHLFPYLSSCIMPLRYKANIRRANERKFGPLLRDRCGSCYKCACESLARVGLGLVPRDPALLRHNLAILRKAWRQVFVGAPPAGDAALLSKWLDPQDIHPRAILGQ